MQWLLLLLPLIHCCDAYLRTNVTLAIHQSQYVSVHVGNPGRTLVLRLRWDMSTSYIYSMPDAWSDTYSPRYGGTELFYLGATKLRLPVVVGQREPDPRLDSSGSVTHDGSLAMGRDSELWLRWRCFTLSRHALILGPCEMSSRDIGGAATGLLRLLVAFPLIGRATPPLHAGDLPARARRECV